jgi:hypothetical protein
MGAGARLVGLRKDGTTFTAEVGLGLQAAINLPAEATSLRIAEALQYLDDTIREIRDTTFTAGIAALATGYRTGVPGIRQEVAKDLSGQKQGAKRGANNNR